MTCKEQDCERKHHAKGWCYPHWRKWRRSDPDLPKCSVEGCSRNSESRGWCGPHHKRWLRHGDPLTKTRFRDPEEAFEYRTMPEPNSGCLLWLGAENRRGYGQMGDGEKVVLSHRFAWERVHGSIPEGMYIDHICHTPQCVNVDHLRLATPEQNGSHKRGPDADNQLKTRNVRVTAQGKFQVRVTHKKEVYYPGVFDTLEEARDVAEEVRQELFGEFAGRG